MTVEEDHQLQKGQALANLEQTLKLFPNGGETTWEGDEVDKAYRFAEESGVTNYEIKHLEFSLLPEDERQDQLDLEARHDFEHRVDSLEDGRERFETFIRLRDEFGLQDPYRVRSPKV